MGRVIILVGSMRENGNTRILAERFAEGASENNSVGVISVADHRVNPCIGCNRCYSSEGNACFQRDGMDEIYPKLAEADVLVISSPVYFYGISAELKAVVDRLHTPLRKTFRIRKLALLLVGATEVPNLFDSIEVQYESVLKFFDLEDAGRVLVGGVKDPGDIIGNPKLEEAYLLGKSIRRPSRSRCTSGSRTPGRCPTTGPGRRIRWTPPGRAENPASCPCNGGRPCRPRTCPP